MSQALLQGLPQTQTCAHCHATTSGRQASPIFAAQQYPAPRSFVGLRQAHALERVRIVRLRLGDLYPLLLILCTTLVEPPANTEAHSQMPVPSQIPGECSRT